MATRSHEMVIDRLFAGKTQLNTALLPLVTATETTLELDAAKRERARIRIDAGAGSISDINWLLMRGYFVVTKDDSTARTRLLAAPVRDWHVDPQDGERQVGVVPVPATDYHAGPYRRTLTRVAVRCRLANGQWGVGVGVVVSSLSHAAACALAGREPAAASDPLRAALAYVYLYDQRGGASRPPSRRTSRASVKEDKQGLGITKRSKKRFAAQQVVVALGTWAHDVLIWAKAWLRKLGCRGCAHAWPASASNA
jgi:hypothetical protein